MPTPIAEVNCIVCRRALEPECSMPDVLGNQPHAATCFQGYGQYGSGAFDPMDGHYLEINVCDECLVAAASEGRVLLGRRYRRSVETNVADDPILYADQRLERWDGREPEEDEEDRRRAAAFIDHLHAIGMLPLEPIDVEKYTKEYDEHQRRLREGEKP